MKATRIHPIHFLLLSLFFVLHGWNDNYPFVSAGTAAILLTWYWVASLVVFFTGWLLFRSTAKAAVLAFATMTIHFFFGAVYDGLKSIPLLTAIASYRYLLPAVLLVFVLTLVYLFRTRSNLIRFQSYLFLLMCVLIAVEIILAAARISRNPSLPAADRQLVLPPGPKPDIYFILLDGYAGERSLRDVYQFDNSPMMDSLRKRGFYICPGSHSNYNFTPFSLASILNMRYLAGIPDPNACDATDYARCVEEIRDNQVVATLRASGYDIFNYSVFDLKGSPSMVNETFLPLKARLINDQTLLSRMQKDLGHLLVVGKYSLRWFRPDVYTTLRNNQQLIRLTETVSAGKSPRPRFIYTHLYMPHPPFYFDDKGNLKEAGNIEINESSDNVPAQLDNLRATNIMTLRLVDTLIANTGGRAAIVLAGDHGFRARLNGGREAVFNTLNAILLPGNKPPPCKDSLASVNLFPVLFNSLFGTKYEMRPDSTIFLSDRQ